MQRAWILSLWNLLTFALNLFTFVYVCQKNGISWASILVWKQVSNFRHWKSISWSWMYCSPTSPEEAQCRNWSNATFWFVVPTSWCIRLCVVFHGHCQYCYHVKASASEERTIDSFWVQSKLDCGRLASSGHSIWMLCIQLSHDETSMCTIF